MRTRADIIRLEDMFDSTSEQTKVIDMLLDDTALDDDVREYLKVAPQRSSEIIEAVYNKMPTEEKEKVVFDKKNLRIIWKEKVHNYHGLADKILSELVMYRHFLFVSKYSYLFLTEQTPLGKLVDFCTRKDITHKQYVAEYYDRLERGLVSDCVHNLDESSSITGCLKVFVETFAHRIADTSENQNILSALEKFFEDQKEDLSFYRENGYESCREREPLNIDLPSQLVNFLGMFNNETQFSNEEQELILKVRHIKQRLQEIYQVAQLRKVVPLLAEALLNKETVDTIWGKMKPVKLLVKCGFPMNTINNITESVGAFSGHYVLSKNPVDIVFCSTNQGFTTCLSLASEYGYAGGIGQFVIADDMLLLYTVNKQSDLDKGRFLLSHKALENDPLKLFRRVQYSERDRYTELEFPNSEDRKRPRTRMYTTKSKSVDIIHPRYINRMFVGLEVSLKKIIPSQSDRERMSKWCIDMIYNSSGLPATRATRANLVPELIANEDHNMTLDTARFDLYPNMAHRSMFLSAFKNIAPSLGETINVTRIIPLFSRGYTRNERSFFHPYLDDRLSCIKVNFAIEGENERVVERTFFTSSCISLWLTKILPDELELEEEIRATNVLDVIGFPEHDENIVFSNEHLDSGHNCGGYIAFVGFGKCCTDNAFSHQCEECGTTLLDGDCDCDCDCGLGG